MILQKDGGRVGQTISHYHILEKLGEGGMGIVYKAEDIKLKRTVALKFLTPQALGTEEEKTRFVHEAQAAAALSHPHIATVYEIDEVEGETFIAMEYIEGESISEKIKSGPLKFEDALDIGIQAAEGLQEAHEKGIVHRDIKSANIMITEKGQAKIMDFGLAKLAGQTKITKTGRTVGTIAYMSPEQARGETIDNRTDIWSLGVILYEMVTGQLPFKGEYEQAVVYSIMNEEPEPMTGLRTGVPMELERVVNKCLEKEPSDRYQHADELIVDLRRLQKEIKAEIPPSRKFVSPEVPRKRFRSFAVPGILVFVALVLVVGYFFFGQRVEGGKRIPVAVVDFVNETDEKELDGLSGMLITALEQSRRLSVLTRSRMFDFLKQMGKEDVDRIDEKLGREIAKNAGLDALVLASIRKFGRLYTIDLKVLDVEKDRYLFTAREEGEGQENVPSMIDRLSEKTRKGLKERANEIKMTTQKVAEVTTPNLEAYQHYFKGEELINKVKMKEAAEEFEEAIALDSTFALAYYRLAYARSWFGFERIKEPIQKAMQFIVKAPEKQQYMIRAENAHLEWNTDEALAIYQEMLKLYPNEKEALYIVGDWSFHPKGDYLTAINYFEKVLAIDPRFERAHQHIIWTYWNMERYDKALEYAKQYVEKVPSEEAYGLLGSTYHLNGDMDEAFQTYQRALELFPNSTMPIVGMGETYIFEDEYGKAEAEFKKLFQQSYLFAGERRGYANLAILNAYVGKYGETLKMVDNMIEIDLELENSTDLALRYAEKAFWLLAEGNDNTEKAKKMIEKGLELKKAADVQFYHALLDAYLIMDEYENAFSIAKNQLLKFNPFVDVFVRAYIHQTKGEYDDAINDYKKMIHQGDIEWYKGPSKYRLGQVYFALGQYEKALEAIQKMQRTYWNSRLRAALYPRSFYLLGKIYEKKGERKKAIENYEKFLDLWIEADDDLPDLIDAKGRLAKLKTIG